MKNRIKEIRKANNMSQAEFGAKIGVKQSSVANYERGFVPLDTVITAICREFGVNEAWLRTGEGEMLSPSEEFDLAEYAKSKGATDLELRIVKAYFALPEDVRRAVMQSLSETFRDAFPAPAPKNVHDWTRTEMDAEYKRQADAEEADRKKGTDVSSTGSPSESGADCA